MTPLPPRDYFEENFGLHIHGECIEPETPKHRGVEDGKGCSPPQPTTRFRECYKLPAPIGSGACEKQFYCTNGILDCTKLVGLHAKIMPAPTYLKNDF